MELRILSQQIKRARKEWEDAIQYDPQLSPAVTREAFETFKQNIVQACDESLRSHLIFLTKSGEIQMLSDGDFDRYERGNEEDISISLDKQANDISGDEGYAGILYFQYGLVSTYDRKNDIDGLDDLRGMLEAALKRLTKLSVQWKPTTYKD